MAVMIPTYKFEDAQVTEKRLYDLIENNFDSDHICLYEIYIGNGRPDFVLIGPKTGIIIFEVKDLPLSSFKGYEKGKFNIKSSDGSRESIRDPLSQIQRYRTQIYKRLKANGIEINSSDKYNVRTMSVVVFGQISRKEFYDHKFNNDIGISDIFERHFFIFKDDLDNIENKRESFAEVLINKAGIKYVNKINLSKKWVDSVKRSLIQNVPIEADFQEDEKIIRLNKEQAKLALGLPTKNIIIRGSAGSGKTIILENRAIALAKEAKMKNKRVLFTFFNKSIGAKIRFSMSRLNAPDNIDITHIDDLNPNIIEIKYKHILIDEAQDIKLDVIKPVIKACLASDGNITMCSDGAQNIYSISYNYNDIGLNFDIYEIQRAYRTTKEIQLLATELVFHEESNTKLSNDKLDIAYVTEDVSYLRRGRPVLFINAMVFDNAVITMEEIIKQWIDNGISHKEIAIITMFNSTIEDITQKSTSIRFTKIEGDDGLSYPDDSSIAISTVNSIKGYEFRNVILIGYDQNKNVPIDQYPTKFYVGLTRATHEANVITTDNTHDVLRLADKINNSLRKSLQSDSLFEEIEQLEYENYNLKKLIESKDKELESLSIELKSKPKEIIKETVVHKKSKMHFMWNVSLIILCLFFGYHFFTDQINHYETEKDKNINIQSESSVKNKILFDAKLTSNNRIDFMIDGVPIRSETSNELLDGDYKTESSVKIVKNNGKYYLEAILITDDSNKIEERFEIEEGRFALVFTNSFVEVRYGKDNEFINVKKSFEPMNGKYFTFLYTDSDQLAHERIDLQ